MVDKHGQVLQAPERLSDLADLPLREVLLRPGAMLYHGTTKLLKGGFPSREANWFALERRQSELHALGRLREEIGESCQNPDVHPNAYLYQYRLKKPARLIDFGDEANYADYARRQLGESEPKHVLEPFTELNEKLAWNMCRIGKYDGWLNLMDQSEVVLCRPFEFLELERRYRYPINAEDVRSFCDELSSVDFSAAFESEGQNPRTWPPPYDTNEEVAEKFDDGDMAAWIREQPAYDRIGLPKNIWVIRNLKGQRQRLGEIEDFRGTYSRLVPLSTEFLREFVPQGQEGGRPRSVRAGRRR
ncbi:MAG: hypothetical protein ACYCOU_06330 [Sulfobacillus sp.]